MNTSVKHIAIFASGRGSNAKKIIEYFRERDKIKVAVIGCNKPGAGVLAIAEENNIAALIIEKEKFFRGNGYVDELKNYKIDLIVLAGFLWKMPSKLLEAFPERIINIHPALLPKYGGKGMYGDVVHETVIKSGEKESGITIHVVDDVYDHGRNVFQITCPVFPGDTPQILAHRIQELEHANYGRVIEEYVKQLYT